MAHIRAIPRKSGGKSFKATVKIGCRSKSKTFRTKREARAWANRVESDRQLLAAYGSLGAAVTVGELINELIQQRKDDNKNPLPTAQLEFWKTFLGKDTKIIDVTAVDIHAGIDKRKRQKVKGRPPAPATVNRYRTCAQILFKFAVKRRHYLSENPVDNTEPEAQDNARRRYLSQTELQKLLSACTESRWPRLYSLVVAAVTTGARKSELLNMRWRDVDFSKRQAYLQTSKNGDPRCLPLPTIAIEALMPFRGRPDDLIWPGTIETSKPFELYKPWNAVRKAAGLQGLRFHDLRHSAASFLINSGATLAVVGAVLGHRSPQSTARYSHIDVEVKKAAVDQTFKPALFKEKNC